MKTFKFSFLTAIQVKLFCQVLLVLKVKMKSKRATKDGKITVDRFKCFFFIMGDHSNGFTLFFYFSVFKTLVCAHLGKMKGNTQFHCTCK